MIRNLRQAKTSFILTANTKKSATYGSIQTNTMKVTVNAGEMLLRNANAGAMKVFGPPTKAYTVH